MNNALAWRNLVWLTGLDLVSSSCYILIHDDPRSWSHGAYLVAQTCAIDLVGDPIVYALAWLIFFIFSRRTSAQALNATARSWLVELLTLLPSLGPHGVSQWIGMFGIFFIVSTFYDELREDIDISQTRYTSQDLS